MDADGTDARRLTRHEATDTMPAFSSSGDRVAFTSFRVSFQPQPYGELHAIRLADRTVVRLIHNKWEDGPTAWVRDVPGLD